VINIDSVYMSPLKPVLTSLMLKAISCRLFLTMLRQHFGKFPISSPLRSKNLAQNDDLPSQAKGSQIPLNLKEAESSSPSKPSYLNTATFSEALILGMGNQCVTSNTSGVPDHSSTRPSECSGSVPTPSEAPPPSSAG